MEVPNKMPELPDGLNDDSNCDHNYKLGWIACWDKLCKGNNEPNTSEPQLPLDDGIKSVCEHPWEYLESVMGDGVLCIKCNAVIKIKTEK